MSDFFRLKAFGHGAAPVGGVIKAREMAELGQAGNIVAEAEKQAKALIAQATAVFESEKVRGYAEGRKQADGERAAQAVADLGHLDSHLSDLERELGGVVFSCVKRIIEGFDDESLAEQTARSALSSMRSERRGQLHVSTSAMKNTRDALPALLKEFPEIELIDVIEDVDLEAPNVRLESTLGVVTFVLDDTLEAMRRLLEQK